MPPAWRKTKPSAAAGPTKNKGVDMSTRKILLTGFPGFIGYRLVQSLAQTMPQADFHFLVLPPFLAKAREQALSLLGEQHNADIIPADIRKERLGLSTLEYEDLQAEVTDIFHLAAIYDLAVPQALAEAVNVTGTQHVVEFARGVKNLRKFVYFSTCYVAGCQTGTVLEDTLAEGQQFKNHYEATKHAAEKIVRQHMQQIPTAIIRPAIVVGDSQTGVTAKFDGPYFSMILVDRFKSCGLPLVYLGSGQALVNVVPVDFVTAATLAIWQQEGSSKCYALADPEPISVRRMYEETVHLLGAYGPWGTVPPGVLKTALRVRAVRRLLKVPCEIVDYFNHSVQFDTRNATAALQPGGVKCPSLLTYLPRLVDFYRRHRHCREMYLRV
jgi:nucleoside-diphosphate-sugar epimerase